MISFHVSVEIGSFVILISYHLLGSAEGFIIFITCVFFHIDSWPRDIRSCIFVLNVGATDLSFANLQNWS